MRGVITVPDTVNISCVETLVESWLFTLFVAISLVTGVSCGLDVECCVCGGICSPVRTGVNAGVGVLVVLTVFGTRHGCDAGNSVVVETESYIRAVEVETCG